MKSTLRNQQSNTVLVPLIHDLFGAKTAFYPIKLICSKTTLTGQKGTGTRYYTFLVLW